jgi:hypothetical protein
MSVIPVGGKLAVTYTSSNSYVVPTYLGYIIATPTGDAAYSLPVRASVNQGAPLILKNRSNFNITITDDLSNVLGVVAPLGTGCFVSTATEWADFSAVDDNLNIPDDLRIQGYLSIGSLTMPSNVVNGAINTTFAQPASQAFGPVTADGTSGLLTFTSSLAAASVATAVISNASVRATSLIILTQQSYAGVLFTDGVPQWRVTAKANGSFTLQLANEHATNALSGALTVGFLVIN